MKFSEPSINCWIQISLIFYMKNLNSAWKITFSNTLDFNSVRLSELQPTVLELRFYIWFSFKPTFLNLNLKFFSEDLQRAVFVPIMRANDALQNWSNCTNEKVRQTADKTVEGIGSFLTCDSFLSYFFFIRN